MTKTLPNLFQDRKIKATIVLPSYMDDHYNGPKNHTFTFVSASFRKVQCVEGVFKLQQFHFPPLEQYTLEK